MRDSSGLLASGDPVGYNSSFVDAPDRAEILPQRVPAEPDVPPLPESIAEELGAPAEPAALARIAAGLRHDALPPSKESFDVEAVLAAVREVPGVREAGLRRNRDGSGVHTLRLELADGADPGQVSRLVARLLGERMGLSAQPGNPFGGPVPAAGPARVRPQQAGRPEPGRPELARPELARPELARPESAGGMRTGMAAADMTSTGVPALDAARVHRGTGQPSSGSDTAYPDTAYQARRRYPGSGTSARPRIPQVPISTPALGTGAGPGSGPTPGVGPRPTANVERPSRPLPPRADSVRIVLDHVQVSTFGLDATVDVRLAVGARQAFGEATGPAVDGYVLRLAAAAAAAAIDQLLVDESTGTSRGRCFVEHAAVVPFGSCEVAVVVVLLVCTGWVEQLAGSAVVAGDPRQSVVRATLAAVNRRLESLLPS